MNFVRSLIIVLSIVLTSTGCERRESNRIADPESIRPPEVMEAHWVMEKDALQGAVRIAAASPLVRRALSESPNPRLSSMYGLAVRAEGIITGGSHVSVTILPHIVDSDSTHATFVSLIERDGRQLVDVGELILGREPTSLEANFRAVQIGSRIGWVKDGPTYLVGADGLPHLAAERRSLAKFVECLVRTAPGACSAGSEIGRSIAPGFPAAGAIGCGVGVAAAAVGCAAQHLF